MPRLPAPVRIPLVLLLLLSGSFPCQAFLGLKLGGEEVFFAEPSVSEADGSTGGSGELRLPALRFEHLGDSMAQAAYGITVSSIGEGIQARWDRYRLLGGFRPGRWKLPGGFSKLGFGMDAGAEVQVLRHFRSTKEAATARPAEPWVVRSPEHVLERLQPGDMIDIPLRAGLLVKASMTTPIAGIPVKPGLFLRLDGRFRVTLLREEDQRVRVRFFSYRSVGGGADVKAGFVWDAELIELLGESVAIVSQFNLLKARWIETWGRGMVLDASIDLGQPEGKEAFRNLFHRPLRLVRGDKKLLGVGWAMVQDIAERQADRDPEDRAAVLHHCGLVRMREGTQRLKMGNSLLQYGRKSFSALLEYLPHEEHAPKVFLASNLALAKATVLFRRYFKWTHESLVWAREVPEGIRAGLWELRYRLKDRRFSEGNLDSLRRRLRFLIGPEWAPELPDLRGPEIGAAKADIRVRFARSALEELAAIPPAELETRLTEWVASLGVSRLWRARFAFSLGELPEILHGALREAVAGTDKQSLRSLADLRRSSGAFQEIGSGFLLHLLQMREDDPRASIYVKYKNVEKARVVTKLGNLEANPSEYVLPILRFLERGQLVLAQDAARVALAHFAEDEEEDEAPGAPEPPPVSAPEGSRASRNQALFRQLHR